MTMPTGELDSIVVSADAGLPEEAIAKEIEGKSPYQLARRRIRQSKVAMASFGFIVLLILVAILAPVLTAIEGHGPLTVNNQLISQGSLDLSQVPGMPLNAYKFPGGSHWLGVSPVNGRDIFARLVYGARVSLTIALLATALSVVLGTVLGAVAAYFRGPIDSIISRFMDLLLAFPQLLLILTLTPILQDRLGTTFLGKGSTLPIVSLVLILGFFGWPYLGRIVRGQVLSLREREYVEAARALGAGLRDAVDPDEHHRRGRAVVPRGRRARPHALLGTDAQRGTARELVSGRPVVHGGARRGAAAHGARIQPLRRRGARRPRPPCEPQLTNRPAPQQ